MTRFLTPAELEHLSRPPHRETDAALAAGAWDEAERLWREQRLAYLDFLDLYRSWAAVLQQLVLAPHGRSGLAEACGLDAVVAGIVARGVTADDLEAGRGEDQVGERLARRDRDGVLAAVDAAERGYRHRHDWLRDWVSVLLSWIYRTHGIDELREALRHGDVPVYRTHVAMMHFLVPIERIGAPWPVVLCPAGKQEVCRILLYKDPRRAAPEHYRIVGLEPPQTRLEERRTS